MDKRQCLTNFQSNCVAMAKVESNNYNGYIDNCLDSPHGIFANTLENDKTGYSYIDLYISLSQKIEFYTNFLQ